MSAVTMLTTTTATTSILSVLVTTIFLLLPNPALSYDTVVVDEHPGFKRIELLPLVIGPESLEFDPAGRGPYTGVSDGRILMWRGHAHGWREFAVPPRRSGVSRHECDGTTNTSMEEKCGRPLGVRFHKSTGNLYIADAYYGLLKVGPRGGVAAALATSAEGIPFHFTNGVDVDDRNGKVYFTDTSTRFQRWEWVWSYLIRDATGRFMSYNPRTRKVKVLLRNLEFANGVAVSKTGNFVLIAESNKQRILRYWLRGPKAGHSEVFANVTGYPDNIKRNPQGQFWVAFNSGQGTVHGGTTSKQEAMVEDAVAVKLGEGGEVLEMLHHKTTTNSVSEVEENNGVLWMGSIATSYVGVYRSPVLIHD